MAADEIHKNDIGTVFTITIKDGTAVVDISTATTKNIIFLKPHGSKLTVAGTFVTDGTDGKIKYTTVAGDLSDVGFWKIQTNIITSVGNWKSDVGNFEVFENI